MTCDEAGRLLLEADPAELAGAGGSRLARHLRDCPRCAAAAADIVDADATLRGFFDAPADEAAVEAIVARVLAAQADEDGVVPIRRGSGRRRPLWASLAVAATAAGLFFAIRDGTPPPVEPARVASAADEPLVQDAGSANVAVIQTDNPDITVLWFF